ncbi:hypothetical protein [Candidatus Aciduliprofundum boonei]|uniref:Uncharacterized protein n=1 Tax=Aciduliprofundum boonei (strain DSM 19572 / T469) TaxID=439481 RepID=B5IDJ7_ACIB4|nr:hypothetical protein [Candidatus Aciduliprofundum boonei]ADD08071.1 hypothetical protein Aboo_0259 [Aciduliprofundum boonei T469]EDY35631.1 hypothetical protein ABOONEI_168 [Aciduliprofundum boonei T469]HII54509.1 hypothetical protein [Candidatus Aciduliprofundum boonei]
MEEDHSEIEELVNEGYIYVRYPKSVNNRVYLYLINPENGDKKSMSVEIESKDELRYFRKTLPKLMRKVSGISYYTGAKKRKKEAHDGIIESMFRENLEFIMKTILRRDEFLNPSQKIWALLLFCFLPPNCISLQT